MDATSPQSEDKGTPKRREQVDQEDANTKETGRRTCIRWLLKNWMALLALLVSGLSAGLAYDQNRTGRQLAHLHMEPRIEIRFDLPEASNPIVMIQNRGDTSVVSVSVDHDLYLFNASNELTYVAHAGYKFDPRMIYREELKPTQYIHSELLDVKPQTGRTNVYVFRIRYYRPEDMRLYERREIFFVKDRSVFSHKDFRTRPSYRTILTQLERFPTPEGAYDPGQLKKILELLDTQDRDEEAKAITENGTETQHTQTRGKEGVR